jgi:IclR family KDG regulon transcriptional repressor
MTGVQPTISMPERASTSASSGRYRVPAVSRALSIMEFLADRHEASGVSAIARALDIPKSSCFSILSTLEVSGYAKRDDKDLWSLTLRIHQVGLSRAHKVDILNVAQPELERLRDATALTAHLGLAEGDGVLYALKVEPPGIIRFDTYPGKRASLHLTAIGRVIAAYMRPEELDAILAEYRFEGGTERAVRSREAFEEQLRIVRANGYALEDEEETYGACCIAAPVTDHHDRLNAAVGVTGLATQISSSSVGELSEHVIAAAESISHLLGAARVSP